MISDEMPNWAVGASAVAAWLALAIAMGNLVYNLLSYRLNLAKERRAAPSFSLGYVRGFVTSDQPTHDRIFAFLVSVTNNSDGPNAIRTMRFRILYSTKSGAMMTLQLDSEPDNAPGRPSGLGEQLGFPLKLEPRQSYLGWIYFRLKAELAKDVTIERHFVVAEDTGANKEEFEPIALLNYEIHSR